MSIFVNFDGKKMSNFLSFAQISIHPGILGTNQRQYIM